MKEIYQARKADYEELKRMMLYYKSMCKERKKVIRYMRWELFKEWLKNKVG